MMEKKVAICLLVIVIMNTGIVISGVISLVPRIHKEHIGPLLEWPQFAARFGCVLEDEPAMLESILPYTKHCEGRNETIVNQVVRSASQGSEVVGISIVNNGVSSFDVLPKWNSRLAPVVAALQDVAALVRLPNVEIPMWLHDNSYFDVDSCIPMMVQEKRKWATGGILAPGRSSSFSTTPPLRGWEHEKDLTIAKHARSTPIAQKKKMAFFRGSPTGLPEDIHRWNTSLRSKIVQLSLDHPALLDARFSSCERVIQDHDICQAMLAANFMGSTVSHSDQWQYQLIVVPDGNSVPDRLLSFLTSNVVVLKSDSDNMEYWYPELQPFRHYIPFKSDASDLIDVIQSVLQNITLLEYISRESTLFVLKRLNPDRTRCYWAMLIREYAHLIYNL
jgi:hypothetical protein